MVFSSPIFIFLFLPIFLVLYLLLSLPYQIKRKPNYLAVPNLFLLLGSLFFYFWGETWFVFVPEKQTIYPEFMPDSLRRAGRYSKLEQLVAYLKRYPALKVIDLREGLFKQKQEHALYSKLSTHWNDYGAFIGYRQLFAPRFAAIQPLKITDFSIEHQAVMGGELPDMLALGESFFKEEIIKLVASRKKRFRLLKEGEYL